MITVDVEKIEEVANHINVLWAAPIMIALTMVFFWHLFGLSALSVLAVIAVYAPINSFYLVPRMAKWQVYRNIL